MSGLWTNINKFDKRLGSPINGGYGAEDTPVNSENIFIPFTVRFQLLITLLYKTRIVGRGKGYLNLD
jgi:hypothetical protein